MAFPTNPSPGDSYTDEYGTVWVYAGAVNGWYRQEVSTPNDTSYTAAISGPAGSNTQVQFNDNGELAGDGGLTYNKTTDALSGGAFIPTGSTVPTNGVYRPSANNVAISTNGTGRLFVDEYGNAGLGTNSPLLAAGYTSLRLNGSTGGLLEVTSAETRVLQIQADGASTGAQITTISNGSNPPLIFGTNSTERLRITSDGKLGLGTSSPAGKAEITSSGSETSLVLRNSSQSLGSYSELKFAPFTGTTAAAASIRVDYGQTDASTLAFRTTNINAEPTTKLFIDSTGRVGVGTTSPSTTLSIGASASSSYDGGVCLNRGPSDYNFYEASDGTNSVIFGLDYTITVAKIGSVNSYPIGFFTGNGERARIDSSGRLLVGTSSTSAAGTLLLQGNSNGATNESILRLGRGQTSIADGGTLGTIYFNDSGHVVAASITARRDGGTWTSGVSQPTRLEFSTCADGSSSPTERMRITSDGSISTKTSPTSLSAAGTTFFGATSVAPNAVNMTRSAGYVLAVNRTTDDGSLVEFYQDTALEGTISVSGTTVSYNGAHLSRWSQLPSGAERIEILRGTVLSNIDEMCEWGDEDNEQLNRMKVSDVEGDKNVSGVFQAWDDDDDTYTNDFYCAMTGDFIIRIGAGVTVERGDLLMSAGDGTAKPQDDDIIRSKTIAKVTSTNVSCTYPDGSYCVPCVLMAC